MNMYTTKLFSKKNIELLNSFANQLPNNADLGKEIRNLFRSDEFVLALPNDRELGAEIRKILTNIKK